MEGFLASPRFGAVVSKLNGFQVDRVVGALQAESPDSAVAFFDVLRNGYGFRHSRFSWLLVSHVLAGKWELGRLRWVLQQIVEEEGSGSAPALCEVLSSSFRDWESSGVVWDVLAFAYSRAGMCMTPSLSLPR